jgi:cytochrome c5
MLLALSGALTACGDDGSSRSAVAQPPTFDDPDLSAGRSVWMSTCRNCHLTGVAGAPALHDIAAWTPRLAKGHDTLFGSVLQGIGDGTTWRMPPRGGNPALSDAQVRQAVDYTLAAVEWFRQGGVP